MQQTLFQILSSQKAGASGNNRKETVKVTPKIEYIYIYIYIYIFIQLRLITSSCYNYLYILNSNF